MVAKWISIAIIVGLIVTLVPVIVVGLWTINRVFVTAVVLFALIIGIVTLVLMAIDKEIQIKRLVEEMLEEENDEE